MTRTKPSFSQSVASFVDSSPWLGPEHSPALATLWALAESLDIEIVPAVVAQFGLTYRSLAKLAPTSDEPGDPLEAALRGAER